MIQRMNIGCRCVRICVNTTRRLLFWLNAPIAGLALIEFLFCTLICSCWVFEKENNIFQSKLVV